MVLYSVYTSPVDKNNTEITRFEVVKNDTFSNLGKKLYEAKLIKSELVYKIFIKLNKPNQLKAGIYSLNKSMNLKGIVDILKGGSTYNPYIVNITIKEGNNIRKIARIIDEKTDNSYDDVLNKLKDNKYISSLISKYWFLTDDILNSKIYYPLEGYLFPETYQISSKNTVEEIFKILLDQTGIILSKYKDFINSSKYTVHQMITLASIIELEAGNANDRSGVAGVFYNRLNSKWTLGSDVTTYYALKIDDFSHSLTKKELATCSNGYNTRCPRLTGLPVGPISNPGEESLKAAFNPTIHKYYYFVADCNGKTYLNTTLSGHSAIRKKLEAENNWCA